MASSRYSGHSASSTGRVSIGGREDGLYRAVQDPRFFPALEALGNAVIGDDLNKICAPEELEEYRAELLRLGEEMVALRQEAGKTATAAQEVQGKHTDSTLAGIPDVKALEEEIKAVQARLPNDARGNDARPDAVLREILSNEDGDVAVVGSGGLQTKCPMTQQIMTQPLLNERCKHYYSPEGFDMMKRAKKLRCPICQRAFQLSDIKRDEVMAARIAQYVQEQEALETQRQTQMSEDATLID